MAMYLITETELRALKFSFTGVFTDPIEKRKFLTENEAKLATKLLDMATREFGNHMCNDVDESMWDGWTVEERRKFVKEFHDYNGDPEEYNENRLHMMDFSLFYMVKKKIEKAYNLCIPKERH